MPRQIGVAFERHIAHQNEKRELEIRQEAERRHRDAEAAGREVRNNLHDEEPTASQSGIDTIPVVPPRPQRRAPQPQPPTTPPASLLDGADDNVEGGMNPQEIIIDLQDQLRDMTSKHDESLREIERMNNEINERERELQGIHEREVAAIDQARLDEANRLGERYDRLKIVLARIEEEKKEAVTRRDESELEIEVLRGQLQRVRAELQEQQLREPMPQSDTVDDARTIGRSSTHQSRSSRDRRSEAGAQRRYSTEHMVRSTWDSKSADRPRHEIIRIRQLSTWGAFVGK